MSDNVPSQEMEDFAQMMKAIGREDYLRSDRPFFDPWDDDDCCGAYESYTSFCYDGDYRPCKEEDTSYSPPFDPHTGHVVCGLYVACVPCINKFDSWADFDKDVTKLLGVPSATSKRYKQCYPVEGVSFSDEDEEGSVPPYNYCRKHCLVTDGHASCGVGFYDDDAYVSMLAAYPMGEGRGGNFMIKLKKFLSSLGRSRILLFTSEPSSRFGSDTGLAHFYVEHCGFRRVDKDTTEVIPATIRDIWYNDTLYVFRLDPPPEPEAEAPPVINGGAAERMPAIEE